MSRTELSAIRGFIFNSISFGICALSGLYPFLQKLFASGYQGPVFQKALAKISPYLDIKIVKRSGLAKEFKFPPRRCCIERTCSWPNRNRLLAKDFENLTQNALAFPCLVSPRFVSCPEVLSEGTNFFGPVPNDKETSNVELIYKILPASLWQEAQARGRFTGAPADLADGFIHFSLRAQVEETAAKWFFGQAGLLLIAAYPARLGRALRFEPSRGGALFPHLYSALPVDAVVFAKLLPLQPDGGHDFAGLL
jgi:uncharacterized protein (DUF952 family)